MAVRFIVNPGSGPSRHARVLQAIRATPMPDGEPPEVCETSGRGHATELATEAAAAGRRLVVAVGGDGTIHEVLQGLMGSETALGVLPKGSGNGVARELGIPLELRGALDRIARGSPRRVDVGRANERWFLSTFGVGFDAHVGSRFEQEAGSIRGQLPYFAIGLKEFFRYRPWTVILHHDGETRRLKPFLLAVANARQYGSGALIAAGARMDDGLLDVVIVPPMDPIKASYYTLKMFSGTLHRAGDVETFRTANLSLELPDGVPMQADGEILRLPSPVKISCEASGLSVWT